MAFRYEVHGLVVASDIELPELRPAPSARPTDVTVSLGTVPDSLDAPTAQGPDWEADATRFVLRVPDVGNYLIAGADTITVEPCQGVAPGDLRLFVLGTSLGVVLHHRGILPLHASTVQVGDAAVAFTGDSGAGKSTIAAHLQARGYPILSDDVSAVTLDGSHRPVVHPGPRRIKLWADALDDIAHDPTELVRDWSRLEKFLLPLAADVTGPVPLRCLYVLQANGRDGIEIDRVRGAAAVKVVSEAVYRSGTARVLGHGASQFRLAARVAATTAVTVVRRPMRIDRMPLLLDLLASEWG